MFQGRVCSGKVCVANVFDTLSDLFFGPGQEQCEVPEEKLKPTDKNQASPIGADDHLRQDLDPQKEEKLIDKSPSLSRKVRVYGGPSSSQQDDEEKRIDKSPSLSSSVRVYGAPSSPQQDDEEKLTDKKPSTAKQIRLFDALKPQQDDEVQARVEQWLLLVVPRAREYFQVAGHEEHKQFRKVLTQLAKGCDKNADPVKSEECVLWKGETTKEAIPQAVIRMVKPGVGGEALTPVNRLIAFLFVSEQDFDRLMKLPKEPFTMPCGDQRCVCLKHVVETGSK